MKVWIVKKELEWLEEMQDEMRTREIVVSSFKRFKDNREVEMELVKPKEEIKAELITKTRFYNCDCGYYTNDRKSFEKHVCNK